MKYIAIEGSSYVGKTTVVDRFAHEGFPVIPEYDAFGPFLPPGDTYESLKIAALDIVNRERRRTDALARAAAFNMVISDRSPFSLVTYEDMMMRVAKTPDEQQLHQDVRSFIIDTLQEEIDAGDIVMPDVIITLQIDSPDAFESRVKKRGITPITHLASFSIQQLIASRTFQYSAHILGEESSDKIDVSFYSENEAFVRVNNMASSISTSTSVRDFKEIKGVQHGHTNAIT